MKKAFSLFAETIEQSELNKNAYSLLLTQLISTVIFSAISPILLLGLSDLSKMGADKVASAISISTISGNILALLITASINENKSALWASISAFGLAAGMVLSTTISAISDEFRFVSIIIAMCIFRISVGVYTNMVYSLMLTRSENKETASPFFAVVDTIGGLGGMIGPVCAALLITMSGNKAVFYMAALLFSSIGIIFYLYKPKRKTPKKENFLSKRSFYSLWINPRLLLLGISGMLVFILRAQAYSYFPLEIKRSYTNWETTIALIFTIYGALQLVFPIFLIGWLNKRSNNSLYKYGWGIATTLFSILLMGASPYGLIFAIGAAFFLAISEITVETYAMDWIGKEFVEKKGINEAIGGYNFLAMAIGVAIGQYTGAAIFIEMSLFMRVSLWTIIGIFAMICTAKLAQNNQHN